MQCACRVRVLMISCIAKVLEWIKNIKRDASTPFMLICNLDKVFFISSPILEKPTLSGSLYKNLFLMSMRILKNSPVFSMAAASVIPRENFYLFYNFVGEWDLTLLVK